MLICSPTHCLNFQSWPSQDLCVTSFTTSNVIQCLSFSQNAHWKVRQKEPYFFIWIEDVTINFLHVNKITELKLNVKRHNLEWTEILYFMELRSLPERTTADGLQDKVIKTIIPYWSWTPSQPEGLGWSKMDWDNPGLVEILNLDMKL